MNTLGPAIMILGLALSMAATADDQRVIVRPTDTGEALINPDIGSYGQKSGPQRAEGVLGRMGLQAPRNTANAVYYWFCNTVGA